MDLRGGTCRLCAYRSTDLRLQARGREQCHATKRLQWCAPSLLTLVHLLPKMSPEGPNRDDLGSREAVCGRDTGIDTDRRNSHRVFVAGSMHVMLILSVRGSAASAAVSTSSLPLFSGHSTHLRQECAGCIGVLNLGQTCCPAHDGGACVQTCQGHTHSTGGEDNTQSAFTCLQLHQLTQCNEEIVQPMHSVLAHAY